MGRKYRINIEGEEQVVDLIESGENDYLITVDGRTYQTHIEEARTHASDSSRPIVTISPNSAPASAAQIPESKLPQQQPSSDIPGAIQINSPLTGTVTTIKVSSGEKVQRGQLLCLLEAMKMEIEIVATHDGVVVLVVVKPGETVRQGDLLFVLQVGEGEEPHDAPK